MEFLLDGIMAVLGPGGWKMIAMYIVGIALIVLAVKKEYEPSCCCLWASARFW